MQSDSKETQNEFTERLSLGEGGPHPRCTPHPVNAQNPPMPTTDFLYVYILRDVATGQHHYTGVTQNLQERLVYLNSGHVPHTLRPRMDSAAFGEMSPTRHMASVSIRAEAK